MKHIVNIHRNETTKAISVESGTNLLELLRQNSVFVETPCGGRGTCGKCAVRTSGIQSEPSDKEKKLLGAERISDGYRLSCSSTITGDIDVYTENEAATEASIITGGMKRNVKLAPAVTKRYIELTAPSLEDQRTDIERVLFSVGMDMDSYDPAILQELPCILRKSGFKVTLVIAGNRLIGVESGNTADKLYGAAFDIGTTTVAAYLYDLNTGECKAVSSMLNPQRKYGADVISRISYAMKSNDAGMAMQSLIIGGVNELVDNLAQKSGILNSDIYMAVFAGNTTMMHLLAGLDAAGIAVAPFIPVTTGLLRFTPQSMNLDIQKNGLGIILPGVSAYVGADTIAAVLSSGMYEDEELSLLVDIGTNGEIVLGSRDWMVSCATAAGPAFEGANIRNGVGGVKGAIDAVGRAPGFKYTTIGDESPVGICGSGIIDAISVLLDSELIDETGRLADEDEVEGIGAEAVDRLALTDNIKSFRLVDEGENGAKSQIVITQKDIRELQNAKAAIAAGISTLIKISGIRVEDVKKVYLAGGFGSSIHIESALRTGLLPKELENRIKAVGNASGAGASECLLSEEMLKLTENIKRKVKYIELSGSADFTESYVENMLF